MTNKNLIERLRWQSQRNSVLPEHGMMQEAAALIEQQEEVIQYLIKGMLHISANTTSDWVAEEIAALLAAKTYLGG